MLPLPSREALTTLRGAAEAIVPLHSIGFVRSLDDARLSFLVFHPNVVIVANVMQRSGGGGIGLWSEEHGFYFDVIRHDTERVPLEIYSMVGLVPLFAATVVEPSTLAKLPVEMETVGNVLNSREFLKSILPTFIEPGENGTRLLSVVSRARLAAILQRSSMRRSSCRSTGCDPSPANMPNILIPSRLQGNATRWSTCPAIPTTACSAATRTGEARSGFR
jgi:hypothetical protein